VAILINKRNGRLESLCIYGDELEPLLGLIHTLRKESPFLNSHVCYLKGIEALDTIMKEFV